MKTFFVLGCLFLSVSVANAEEYRPPEVLNPEQAKTAFTALVDNKINLLNHWKGRVELAKKNNAKLSKSGIPFQKPYYGDSGLHH